MVWPLVFVDFVTELSSCERKRFTRAFLSWRGTVLTVAAETQVKLYSEYDNKY
jgi:hypothetical protein